MSRRRQPRSTLPLVVPRPSPRPPADDHRAVIGSQTLRGAWDAHRSDQHRGKIGRDCRTCTRYGAALAIARAREAEHGEAFEVPTSAANAYAATLRPHVGGLA